MTGKITLAGQSYTVSVGPDGTRYIGDETTDAFIERMHLLGRTDVLSDLANIGRAKLKGNLDLASPQATAFALHQRRTRSN